MSNEVKIVAAHSPRWADEEKTAITLTVELTSIEGEIPFTACPGCSTEYGRELFTRSKFGEYGEIADYNGPTKEETQQIIFLGKRAKAVTETETRIRVLERAAKFGMITPEEEAELDALEFYSVQLMRAKGPILPTM